MRTKLFRPLQSCFVSAIAILLTPISEAAEIKRANASGGLNLGAAWVGGVVPGPNDIAVWDSTITTVGNCTNAIGAILSWSGIKVLSPAATAQISQTTSTSLSLGAGGINVADPLNTRDLVILCNMNFTNNADVNIKGGRTFSYARQFDILDNTTINITNTGTIRGINGGNCIFRVGQGTTGTATVNQSAGTNICNQTGPVVVLHIGKFAGNLGVYNLSGGVIDTDDVPGSILRVGDTVGCEGRLNVSGGQIFADIVQIGGAGGIGTLTLSGSGAMNLVGNLIVPNHASSSGAVNLDGGTLTLPKVTMTAGVSGTFNFNGGTLIPTVSASDFLQGLTQTNVKEGGARINAAGFDITIAQNLLHGGVAATDGGLTKSGAGTLTLSGANTYNGPALVNAGKFVTSTASAGGGSVTVADGAIFGVTVTAAGSSLKASAMTLGTATGATSEFNLGVFGSPTAPVVYATNLTTHGTVPVNISGVGLAVGQFPLIKYSGGIGGSGYAAFSLGTLPPGVSANLVDNSGNSSVDLNITVAPRLIWTAANSSDWNIQTTTNWLDSLSALPTYYTDGYPVVFDDRAASGNVQITVGVSPGGVTVSNNSLPYSFGGAGSIISGSLKKEGTGNLTLNTAQTYSGDTTISAGKITLGIANAIPGGSAKGNVTVNGTLDLAGFGDLINGLSGSGTVDNSTGTASLDLGNNNIGITFPGTIQNVGGVLALTKSGSSAATLSGNNSYSGGTTLAAGILQAGHNNAFGSGTVQMNGGTLSSDGAPARTLPNNLLITTAVTIGSLVNSGPLTLAGGVDFNAGARNLTVNSDVTITGPLSNGGPNKLGVGNLILKGSGNLTVDSEARLGQLILDGAAITNTGTLRADASVNNSQVRMVLTNGAILVLVNTTANFRSGYDANTSSTNFVDVGGTVRIPNADASNGRMVLGAGCLRGVINLLAGGDVEVRAVVPADVNDLGASELNLNGGTLRPIANNTAFMQNLTEANVRDGGAVFDTGGFDITVAQSLRAGGTGGLTKNGAGTLTLTGTNTYTGATIVNAGKLVVTPAQSGGGTLTANDGTTLGVKLVSAGTSLNTSAVTLGNATGATNEFNLAALGNPTVPVLNTTTLATHGAVVVNISGAGLSVGQFPLIKYTGAIGGSGYVAFSLGTLPLGVSASLVNNTVNSSVDLQITAIAPVLWSGAINGDWDIGGTANWTVSATPTTYQEPAVPGPAVRFDNSATGTRDVNVTTVVSPASVTVSNTSPAYSFGGAGRISGPASLTKQGSGTLTVSSANDYSGATVISAGKLALGASEVIPAGAGKADVTVNGTFDLAGFSETINGLTGAGTVDASAGSSTLTMGSNNASSTFSGTIINSGGTLAVTKIGSGTIALTGNSTYSGGTTISNGSVQVGSNSALGAGTVTLSAGNLSSDSVTARSMANPFLVITASSFGNATNNGLLTINGPIDFNGAGRGITFNSDVTFTGTMTNGSFNKDGTGLMTIKGTADMTAAVEIRKGTCLVDGAMVTNTDSFRPDTTASPGFARLIITNGAALILTGTNVNGRVGYTGGDNTSTNILDLAGLYRMPNADSANGVMTVGRSGNRGILNLYAGGDLQTRQLLKATTGTGQYGEVNFDGGTLRAANDHTAFITGLDLVTVRSGGVTIDSDVWSITVPQPLLSGGSGGLTKIGSGTLLLDATNTYTGTTLVSAGTLGGNGIIAGPVRVASGASFSPGTSIGALTVNSSLTLSNGSITFIELNKTAATNDVVKGLTSVTYGGTLSLTNLDGDLAAGDTFTIFSSSSYGGAFASLVPAVPGAGLNWDTSQLTISGTLRVVAGGGVATNPTNITFFVSGGSLDVSWPADHTGWRLEAQTDNVTVGLTTNWFTVAGSAATNRVILPINPGSGAAFFRLVYP